MTSTTQSLPIPINAFFSSFLGITASLPPQAFSGFAARQYSDFCQELPGFFFQNPVLNGLTAAFSIICYPIQKSGPPFILFNLGQANRFPFFRPQHSSALGTGAAW
ncbi:MAG: hypothetical protein ACLTEF_01950 [[Clostridium] leptum]